MHDELADYEWAAIKPMVPNKPREARAASVDGSLAMTLLHPHE
jgi:hypothetical protein